MPFTPPTEDDLIDSGFTPPSENDLIDTRPKSVEFGMGVPLPGERVDFTPEEKQTVQRLRDFLNRPRLEDTRPFAAKAASAIRRNPVGELLFGPEFPSPVGPQRGVLMPDPNIHPLPIAGPQKSEVAQIAAGVYNPVAGLVNSAVANPLPFAAFEVPGLATVAKTALGTQMAVSLPEQLQASAGQPVTTQSKIENVLNTTLYGGGALGLTKSAVGDVVGGVKGRLKVANFDPQIQESAAVLPKAAEEISKVEPEKPVKAKPTPTPQDRLASVNKTLDALETIHGPRDTFDPNTQKPVPLRALTTRESQLLKERDELNAKILSEKPSTTEVSDATQERQVQEGVQRERVGTDAQRVSAEASPGNIVQPAAEVRPQQPQPEVPQVPLTPPGVNPQAKEWLTHAAYEEPETGDVYTGANHPEILDNLGIEGFPTRESRNTPQFGFRTNLRAFVPREEAAKIAKASGQQLEPFEIGPKGEPVAHSDQIASPTEPGKTIAEQKPLNPGGALKDLSPELQAKHQAASDAMRAEFEKLKKQTQKPISPEEAVANQPKAALSETVVRMEAEDAAYKAKKEMQAAEKRVFDLFKAGNPVPIELANKAGVKGLQGYIQKGDAFVKSSTQGPTHQPTPVKAETTSPTETLSTASQVKVTVPEGATYIQGTTTKGKVARVSVKDINKGANTFRGEQWSKIEAGTIGKDKKFVPMAGDVSVTPKVFAAGPGAATATAIEADIGAMESNIPPLEKLADAVKEFPKQPGSWKEALGQWLNDVGVPAKDFADRALAASKAAVARVIAAQRELPEVTSMDRAVGKWNLADTEGDLAAQRFAGAVRTVFKDRSKLRALSNWIDAAGDKEILRQRAEATKDPALRKTYEDASKFGPDEERLAREIQQYHDEMLAWAQREGALEEGLENYLHRYYKANDPVLEQKLSAVRYLRFTKDFNGFKRRFYASDFDAEQAGLSPEKDAARRILAYDQGFRKALTARAFVKDRYSATMKDGRPELDIAGMGVRLEPGQEGGRTVTLVKPKWKQNSSDPMDYRGDYVPFDHPAFRKHKWVSSDENGNPTLVQGDILVHPDAVKQYNALFGKSWWKTNPIGRALLAPSNMVKQTMLSLSGFHPVQIAVHAIEHKTNPFRLKDLNVRDPAQAELVEGGLTIADTSGSMAFSEGVASAGGLLGKIPIIGEQLRLSNDWLFKDFIPRIKMTMALDALGRNQKRYSKELASGKITREQLVRLTAREANAAFGEQNYRAMFRNPTFQDTLRFLFLAPDFGEARLKFPLQALTKYGGEQRMALILGALGMATVAKLVEKELTGQVNWKRPFTVTYKDREYGLRNVASDLYHLISDPGGYARNRLNPIYTRAALEALSGRDAFGRKRNATQQLLDEAKTVVPISTRGLTDREQRFWESFMNAMGLTERRRSSFSDAMKNVNDWKKKMGYENSGEFVYDADKDPYHPLTQELTFGSDERALRELNKLIQGKSITERRKIYDHYQRALGRTRYLTGSKEKEREYVKTLKGEELLQYQDAIKERHEMYQRFQRVWNKRTINQL